MKIFLLLYILLFGFYFVRAIYKAKWYGYLLPVRKDDKKKPLFWIEP